MYWRWNVLNFIRRNALSFTPFLRKYVMITLMCYNDSATYDWKGNARGIFIILTKVKPFTDYNESNFEDFLSSCSPNFKMTDTRLQKRLFRVRKMHIMKHSQVACFKIVLKKKVTTILKPSTHCVNYQKNTNNTLYQIYIGTNINRYQI